MWFFTLVVVGVVILICKYWSQKPLNLPGPKGIPFLGNVHQLKARQPHNTICEWSKKYGEVFKMKMFGRNFVVLNSYEAIYEGLVKKGNDVAGRPPSYRIDFFMNGGEDVAFGTFSKKWAYMKKTTMQTLKMYGDNMINLERLSLECIDDMLEDIKKVAAIEGKLDIVPFFHRCVTAIITSVLYGKKETKAKVKILEELTVETQTLLQPTGINVLLDIFPLLRFLPPFNKIFEIRDKVNGWFESEVSQRKREFIPGDPQCFIDGLFDHQHIAEETHPEFSLSYEDIVGITRNMIFAGTSTTALLLNALVTVLINKPEIQEKMADEIRNVLQKRTPTLSDRASLPYVEATIFEVLRYASIVPLNLPHYTMVDTSIKGFQIPKDTTVLFNLWNLHHSEEYWEKPWDFTPERFLDEEGNLIPADHINRKRLLAFGASRRVCAGENLARNRLSLIVISLIQNFRLEAESPDKLPVNSPRDFDATFGIVIPPYKVKVIPRL